MSQQINLYNPIFLAQKKYFSAAAMLQALGLVLVAMLLFAALAAHQTSELQGLLASLLRDAAREREQLVNLGKQFSDQGTSKKLEDDIVRVADQLRRRRELLTELTTNAGGNARGFSDYLAALARQRTQGVWLTGIEISGSANDLVIKGRALNSELVPIYVRSLSREPVFAGRALNSLQITARQETPPPAPQGPEGSAAPAPRPLRYLEFTLNIPLGAKAAAPAAQQGTS